MQEQNLPFKGAEEAEKVAATMLRRFAPDQYPHLAELAVGHVMKPGYSYAKEFEFGLDLILGALERLREEA